jgi:hypothetical protein
MKVQQYKLTCLVCSKSYTGQTHTLYKKLNQLAEKQKCEDQNQFFAVALDITDI